MPEEKIKQEAPKQELKHLVRIANADLKGTVHLMYGIKNVKGIGFMLANAVCKIANMETTKKAGTLTDQEIKKLDEMKKPFPDRINPPEISKNLTPASLLSPKTIKSSSKK